MVSLSQDTGKPLKDTQLGQHDQFCNFEKFPLLLGKQFGGSLGISPGKGAGGQCRKGEVVDAMALGGNIAIYWIWQL